MEAKWLVLAGIFMLVVSFYVYTMRVYANASLSEILWPWMTRPTIASHQIMNDEEKTLEQPAGAMLGAIERLNQTLSEMNARLASGNSAARLEQDTAAPRAATAAMANLAEAIHGLVSHMRTEQQMIRDWADIQAQQGREIQRLLEQALGERTEREEAEEIRRLR